MLIDFGFKPFSTISYDTGNIKIFVRCGDSMTETCTIKFHKERRLTTMFIKKGFAGMLSIIVQYHYSNEILTLVSLYVRTVL